MARFFGKRVLVVGGGRGIGRHLARAFASEGAQVAVASRTAAQVLDTADSLAGKGVGIPCDVRRAADVEMLRDRVVAAFGGLDILVNAAGVFAFGPTTSFDEAAARDIIETNVMGTYASCRAFGPLMLSQGHGKIVNFASLLSFTSFPQRAAYGASKAAVRQLTQSLAVEWAPHGVQVNAVAPGMIEIETPHPAIAAGQLHGDQIARRVPAGRRGRPDDVVGPVLFLASPDADYVCGQTLVVDGGWLSYGYL
ncbi:SDR family oxidoreductase [Streptomyces sp900105245]|uniref:SDR family oxidoreductase n=1 Tax=Streptomyces sp. 900105245 TaxID=3154379 RepID=A0ABV1UJ84_9ACTN